MDLKVKFSTYITSYTNSMTKLKNKSKMGRFNLFSLPSSILTHQCNYLWLAIYVMRILFFDGKFVNDMYSGYLILSGYWLPPYTINNWHMKMTRCIKVLMPNLGVWTTCASVLDFCRILILTLILLSFHITPPQNFCIQSCQIQPD